MSTTSDCMKSRLLSIISICHLFLYKIHWKSHWISVFKWFGSMTDSMTQQGEHVLVCSPVSLTISAVSLLIEALKESFITSDSPHANTDGINLWLIRNLLSIHSPSPPLSSNSIHLLLLLLSLSLFPLHLSTFTCLVLSPLRAGLWTKPLCGDWRRDIKQRKGRNVGFLN